MKETIGKAIEKNNLQMNRMKKIGTGWKTVARRKARKPNSFRTGIEELVKPKVQKETVGSNASVAKELCRDSEVLTARICPLKAIEPKESMAVTDNDGWMSVDLAVDSVATETVLN